MTLESPNLRRKRLERQKLMLKNRPKNHLKKIMLSTVLRIVSMIVFANIFNRK